MTMLRRIWHWLWHGANKPDRVSESWLRDHQYRRDGY
jgi:hypothetical protein